MPEPKIGGARSVDRAGGGLYLIGVAKLDNSFPWRPDLRSAPVPPAFANQSTFLTLVEAYSALNAMTYFDTTMTTGNYTNFTTAAPKSAASSSRATP